MKKKNIKAILVVFAVIGVVLLCVMFAGNRFRSHFITSQKAVISVTNGDFRGCEMGSRDERKSLMHEVKINRIEKGLLFSTHRYGKDFDRVIEWKEIDNGRFYCKVSYGGSSTEYEVQVYYYPIFTEKDFQDLFRDYYSDHYIEDRLTGDIKAAGLIEVYEPSYRTVFLKHENADTSDEQYGITWSQFQTTEFRILGSKRVLQRKFRDAGFLEKNTETGKYKWSFQNTFRAKLQYGRIDFALDIAKAYTSPNMPEKYRKHVGELELKWER